MKATVTTTVLFAYCFYGKKSENLYTEENGKKEVSRLFLNSYSSPFPMFLKTAKTLWEEKRI